MKKAISKNILDADKRGSAGFEKIKSSKKKVKSMSKRFFILNFIVAA